MTETKAADETASRTGHPPSIRQDPTKENQVLTQDNFPGLAGNRQEYPNSEIDAWDWDELEASPPHRNLPTNSISNNTTSCMG